MSIRIETLTIDAADPVVLAAWWAEALGWEVVPDGDDPDEVSILPRDGDDSAVRELLFLKVSDAKTTKIRWHLDLRPDDQAAEVSRFEQLGARRVDIGQNEDSDEVTWVVLCDPEGNEFCILRAPASA